MVTIRKEKFIPGQYYHIYSRVIFNIPEFKPTKNAERLALNFLIANSTNSEEVFRYLRNNRNVSQDKIQEILKNGKKIVDIICYSIMPDHYHLLIRERKENGIINFVHKCNTSVAKYINIRNERRGPLFENRFKAKHINENNYLLHLSLYIHLNPLDFLTGKEWREHGVKDWKSARVKLLKYPWSSLNAYLEKENNPITSGTDIIAEQFDSKEDYENFLRNWSKGEIEELKDVIID